MSNRETVAAIYEAFGNADVAAILENLSDDVVWEYPPSSTDVPWLQQRVGRENVPGFFASLGGVELTKFEVKDLLEGNDAVVALIDVELTVKSTGKTIAEQDEIHVWRFDGQGKVRSFKHGIDTHAHHLAILPD